MVSGRTRNLNNGVIAHRRFKYRTFDDSNQGPSYCFHLLHANGLGIDLDAKKAEDTCSIYGKRAHPDNEILGYFDLRIDNGVVESP